MNVSCPECRSIFRIDPAKVPTTGVRARCSVCGGILAIGGGSLPVTVTPFGGVTRSSGTPTGVPAIGGPPSVPVPRLTPAVAVPAWGPPASPPPPPPLPPPVASPVPEPIPVPTPPSPVPAVSVPAVSVPATAGPMADAPPTPVMAPAVAPVEPPAPSDGAASAVPPEGRRPINPFLQVDPVQRARRLARALVSDLVAYHPQKREEGLRDGSLRQLFREDIKKSYEEYVEQVGQEVAEQSSHFQDALNDILAGGRRLF